MHVATRVAAQYVYIFVLTIKIVLACKPHWLKRRSWPCRQIGVGGGSGVDADVVMQNATVPP